MTERARPYDNPFDLHDEPAYQRWRAGKLERLAGGDDFPIVAIADVNQLQEAEIAALLRQLQRCNMAIYDTGAEGFADKEFVRRLGRHFGLTRLDGNPYSDEDDISSITVKPRDQGALYIPYTDRPISWHTDGYYNAPEVQVRSFILHCARPAARGGENRLLDPELAYIHLRDENPDYIAALMAEDAMSIPANEVNDFVSRPLQSGPVFSVQADGTLHMRFTARKRHVIWREDAMLARARDCLSALLDSDSRFIYRHRLDAGQGLIANNVLHSRSAFEDGTGTEEARLLYRARYHDRIKGTGMAEFTEAI